MSSTTLIAHDQVEELAPVVQLGGRGLHPVGPENANHIAVTPQLHSSEARSHQWQEPLGHGSMHDEWTPPAADAGPLGLGVDDDRGGHVEVG